MTDVLIPGGRDVRGTLEEPDDEPRAVVVACPPHPRHGGSRRDARLVAVAEALCESGIACLRFDYGEWDDGYGEREDVRNAIRWARDTDRFDGASGDECESLPVGVFGYSFGASMALLAAPDTDPDAVSALAPTARIAPDLDVVAALESLECPVQILYGERDSTVEWEPVVERARDRGDTVSSMAGDHFFSGNRTAISAEVSGFYNGLLSK
ncbi:hypothetical protein SAMN04487967_2694 [Natronorubrum sediminis]|uniref:Serine aminopeptidase S33 domain-containing protein n=1 Tax=Natronorubrum sediminis TaxID=640943 RepID=A0A1H6G0C6_9EURY|nr:alpha/beta family hydrolase [Natronorubrum sediminis]SEH16541.1 hypothetical protein SAMN04487967_2694 [Natronorubrum sediminis]